MRGKKGSNEIADAHDNLEVWKLLTDRLLLLNHYQILFESAYPEILQEDLNFGHAATALAAFQRQAFVATDTSFDRYLGGNFQALTHPQKRGALLFFTKAKCAQCHTGSHLSPSGSFFSVGIPQVITSPDEDDLGRFGTDQSVWPQDQYRYAFRVPPLRNVALTAPYMHNGAFKTLREVVDHYNDTQTSLLGFKEVPPHFEVYGKELSTEFYVDQDPKRLGERLEQIDPILQSPLGLSSKEKEDLVDFLENGLTDLNYFENFQNRSQNRSLDGVNFTQNTLSFALFALQR
jgi:cytochrome c peroxidase